MKPLSQLLAEANEKVKQMSPEQKAEMLREQRRSFARAEAGFGSDKDEAEYAAALHAGDKKKLAELDAESAARIVRAEKIMKERGL